MKNAQTRPSFDKRAALKSSLIGAALSLIIIFAIPPLLINPILNGLKNNALNSVKTGKASAGHASYNLFFNEISIHNLSYNGRAGKLDTVYARISTIEIEDANWLKYIAGMGISAGRISFYKPYIIMGALKKMREKPENKEFSAVSVFLQKETSSSVPDILKNIYIGKIEINSGSGVFYGSEGKDSVGEYYIDAKGFEMKEGSLQRLSSLNFLIRNVCKTFPKGYEVTAGFVQYINSKKLFEAENIKYYSKLSADEYFASLALREDKLAFEVKKISAKIGELQIGEKPRLLVEMIKLQNPKAHITTPKYIPLPENAPKKVMPNEILLNLPFGIKLDELIAEEGSISLHELYKPQGKYAKLIFDNLSLEAKDITSRFFDSKAPAHIKVKAYLQGKGEMTLDLTMPIRRDFSYAAKGSLKEMDLRELNSFLEDSEYMQIVSGRAEKVDYEINAENGRAEVTTTPVYHDIKIKSLDEGTGKESGLDEKAASFIANKFVLRTSNPEKKDGLKTARVSKTFYPDETFFERLWLPLKKGLGEVVGFEE